MLMPSKFTVAIFARNPSAIARDTFLVAGDCTSIEVTVPVATHTAEHSGGVMLTLLPMPYSGSGTQLLSEGADGVILLCDDVQNEDSAADCVAFVEANTKAMSLCTRPIILWKVGEESSPATADDGAASWLSQLSLMLGQCSSFVEAATIPSLQCGSAPVMPHLARLVHHMLAPCHLLWEARNCRLSPLGEVCATRAFWIIDRDGDGRWSKSEVRHALVSMKADSSYVGVAQLIAEAAAASPGKGRSPKRYSPMRQYGNDSEFDRREISLNGFLGWVEGVLRKPLPISVEDQCEASLDAQYRRLMLWCLLASVGNSRSDGQPFTKRDLQLVCDTTHRTYLSRTGIQFFANLYRQKCFAHVDDVWCVTPGCPWTDISGFPTKSITLDQFIESWKWMAVVRREAVVCFARHWGFRGDSALLLVRKPKRSDCAPLDSPNIISVLVVGSPRCGKSTLIRFLAGCETGDYGEEPGDGKSFARTMTFTPHAVNGNGDEVVEPTSLCLQELTRGEAEEALSNPSLLQRFDVVLFCFEDGNAESAAYIRNAYLTTKGQKSCCDVPCLLVMTKADLGQLVGEEVSAEGEMKPFCARHCLQWPPVTTTIVEEVYFKSGTMLLPQLIVSTIAAQPVRSSTALWRNSVLAGVVLSAAVLVVRWKSDLVVKLPLLLTKLAR